MDWISVTYFIGVFLGYTLWAFYLFWLKHNKDSTIVFGRKYFYTWLFTTLLAVGQLALELIGNPPVVAYPDVMQAFLAGFVVYFFVQELIKGVLKIERIDFFNT